MSSPRVIRRRVAPVDGNGDGDGETFDGQVGASNGDSRQFTDDTVDPSSPKVHSDHTEKHGGFRWMNVTIPAGATIDVAHVGVYIWSTANDRPRHQLRGELDANPGVFTTSNDDIDSRVRTTATVNWDSAELGAATDEYWEWGASAAGEGNGANLNDIVQEIIDQGGWASGNSIVVIWEQHTSPSATRDMGVRAWDHDPSLAAKLHVEFTT